MTTVRSFCKINLGLRIGPPRADGFHALRTLYQTVGLHDVLSVRAAASDATEIVLTCNDPRVPCDGRNTVFRMLSLALETMGVRACVTAHLQKNLPIQGGLGAGSANAASALLALERELGRALPGPERFRVAEQIGSDVPLFLLGGTVYGHNRGEQVLPYPDLPSMPCVVVSPTVGSSTPAAFRAWDQQIGALTPDAATDRLTELSRVYASAFAPAGLKSENGASGASGALAGEMSGQMSRDVLPGSHESRSLAGNPLPALVRTGIENDFQEVVFQQHPFLRDILHALWGEDGVPEENRAWIASLSGSGSSLFGLYRTMAAAEAAQARLRCFAARSFLTETLSRRAYWETLFPG